MRSLALLIVSQFVVCSVSADSSVTSPTSIDQTALNNQRLFFSAEQRKALLFNHPANIKAGATTLNKIPTQPKNRVQYTGVVHSARGIQLLLNGLPWRSGLLGVVRVRLKRSSNLIEIETTQGFKYRLLPGEHVEIKP